MTDKRDDPSRTNDAGDASTLVPMLVAGLVLITVGMIAVALFV